MPELPNTTARKPEEERFTLGNFEILRDETGGPLMLGKGTFGRTYKARHRFLDTIVALKVITERYVADATVRQRFLAEAKAVARLSHPNIASIYDFGEADGALYYAMEFCSGGNLSSYVLKRGPLGVPQVLEIAIQASGALACAHAASFVHRDVKPSNLMLASPEGPLCCKLIDFGLVHATSPSAQPGPPGHPDEGQFFGTPLFASPEQLREQPVDGRSDLFSLGMTLWFLLLGGPPEPGAFSAIATSRLSPESYLPRLPKDLPAPLLHLLGQLLEKDPALRVADGAAAYAAFLRCASVLGMPAAPQISAPGGLGSGEPQASERNREVPPAEIEEVPEVLESKFKLTSRLNVAFTGTFYAAEPRDRVGQTVLLHVLQPEVAQDAALVEQIRANIGRLQAFAPPSVIRPMAIRRYQDFTAVEMGALPAGVLLNELRSQGILLFSKVCPFLEAVALQNDQIEELTLPGLDLRPASVFFDAGEAKASGAADLAKVTPRLLPRLVAATEAGSLESSGPADTSSTMTSDNFGDPARDNNSGAQFAGLIYRIVSGRNSPAAASLSPQGYVAASGLSERANRILSLVIAGQTTYSTCGEMLRELLGLEGVSGSMAGSQGATHSKAPAMQTRSFAPIARSAETATFARTSAPPGRVTERTAPPVAKPPAGKRASLFLAVAAAAAVLALGGYFFFYRTHSGGTTQAGASSLPEKLVVQLQNDDSIQPVFKIGDKAVPAAQEGNSWSVPLREAAPQLPFVLTAEAVGYDDAEVTMQSPNDLAAPVPLTLIRSVGKVSFTGIPADYTGASCLMKQALPEERDHVDIPKYAIGTELHGDATAPFELPTGIYLVSLKGRGTPQRWPVLATVKKGATSEVGLPPLVEGKYSGNLAGGQNGRSFNLDVQIATRHGDGWIKRGDQQQTLVEGRVAPDGGFLARALPAAGAPDSSSDTTILIRYNGSDSYDVYLTDADATQAQDFAPLGTVHRTGDL